LEQQIEELQIKLSFQEDILKQLDDVLSAQGKELLQLKSEIRNIQLELRSVRQSQETLENASIEKELPPHY
jgi:SlyX protein|tara:strand:+ start:184 stop:396 length:213 start_codon:yes stop_codon:yes gene_type:complete